MSWPVPLQKSYDAEHRKSVCCKNQPPGGVRLKISQKGETYRYGIYAEFDYDHKT